MANLEKSPILQSEHPRVIGTWDFIEESKTVLLGSAVQQEFDLAPERKVSVWGIEKSLDIPEAEGLAVRLIDVGERWLVPNVHAENVKEPLSIWLFNPDYTLTEPDYTPEYLKKYGQYRFLLFQTHLNPSHQPPQKRLPFNGVRVFAYDKNTHQFISVRYPSYGEIVSAKSTDHAVISSFKSIPNNQRFASGMKVVVTEGLHRSTTKTHPISRKTLFAVAKTFDQEASADILTANIPQSLSFTTPRYRPYVRK